MQGNYLSPIIDALKPILIFAAVIWGASENNADAKILTRTCIPDFPSLAI